MPEEQQQEKTEAATPKRQQEAREKGNVPKSIEINSAFLLLGTFLFFWFTGERFMQKLMLQMHILLENIGTVTITPGNLPGYVELAVATIFELFGPIMIVFMLLGLAVNYAQVGFLLAPQAMAPKWSKVNPASGLKRILGSKKTLIELAKGLLKLGIIGLMTFFALHGDMAQLVRLMDQDPQQIIYFIADRAFVLGMKISLLLLGMALLDFMFQRWDHAEKLKMTKQEVKEELKQMEGDPQLKARIRSIQREMARKRMMEEVPDADVVVTNPTTYAVALKYDVAEMDAPIVVAKGARLLADKIKKLAQEAGIPIVENKPLARALYRAVEVGDPISEDLFRAVAEVLSFVYSIDRRAEKIRERRDMIKPAQAPVSA